MSELFFKHLFDIPHRSEVLIRDKRLEKNYCNETLQISVRYSQEILSDFALYSIENEYCSKIYFRILFWKNAVPDSSTKFDKKFISDFMKIPPRRVSDSIMKMISRILWESCPRFWKNLHNLYENLYVIPIQYCWKFIAMIDVCICLISIIFHQICSNLIKIMLYSGSFN